jgi:hypothetical protein
MEKRDLGQLSGEVHMDGAYVNGHIRPKNKKACVFQPSVTAHSSNMTGHSK